MGKHCVGRLPGDHEGWIERHGVSLALETTVTAGDRLRLQRALGNLLSNRIRHTPPGGTVHVRLSHANDGRVTVIVENPGKPILSFLNWPQNIV